MRINCKSAGTWLISLLLLSSCTFLPAVSEEQKYAKHCDMYTKELTLKPEFFDMASGCGTGPEAPACLLAIAVGLPAVSLVVSGSIVMAGNTIHWLEYHGVCPDTELLESI